MRLAFLLIILVGFGMGCKDTVDSLPKPRMYPRVVFPERAYQAFSRSDCPFVFEYPTYASIVDSDSNDKERADNPCWFDIHYSAMDAVLYCSYATVVDQKDFETKVNKNYLLVNKHNRRADFIEENIIQKNGKPVGLRFEIEGEVATPIQFFLTDTITHFFRASLYFNAPPNPDSIAPIFQFVKKDVDAMIASFEWK